MASATQNFAARTMARFRRFMGINSSSEISDSRKTLQESVHYGMFTEDELRHVDGIRTIYGDQGTKNNIPTEETISRYLSDVASNTRKKIDEIKNLKILAPEIEQAKSIIVSSILSPCDLQTDSLSIKVDHPGLTTTCNDSISEYLTNYFNNEYHLGPKLVEWLGCAGFEEGAKPILVLPKNELDVLNVVADQWDKETINELNRVKMSVKGSTEALLPYTESSHEFKKLEAAMEAQICATLEEKKIGSEFVATEDVQPLPKTKNGPKYKTPETKTAADLARILTKQSFELLRTSERGDAVIVTHDMRDLGKIERNLDSRISELEKEAERQIFGFKAGDDVNHNQSLPVLALSDVIKTGDDDMPIVIELPCDSVIPVCAPHDCKNHIGYYIMIDENGQPCRGLYAFNAGVSSDVNNRLATNAAKAVYGGAAISTYTNAGMTDNQTLTEITQVFSVAVNHLLRDKLRKDGLNGLDVNVHEAVGKCLFFNLLAKNKIKMVFVPSPMLIYYRFLHREDGTGKTFLEDIAFLLALRCTLTIAKIMAAVDNATQHRRIEVNVDEKNNNPIETLNIVRNAYLSKKAPSFPTDPTTAAESIINQHLSIVPKGLVGNTDDLTITTEKSYGQSQAPDNELMETLNNWVCQGLKLPPSALNQLNETEYAKSVATCNLFFSNAVRGWQDIIKPYNKKFILNYILCNHQMLDEIRKLIHDDFSGAKSKTKRGIRVAEEDDKSETQSQDPQNDEKIEMALKRVIATAEIVLAPPKMAVTKSHFEEVNSQVDAVDKLLEKIYPDDAAPNDEIRSLMASVRAIVASKALRDFLPKLGFHEITDVPDIEEINADEAARIILRLGDIKKRMDLLFKMQSGQLKDQPGAGGDMGGDFGGSSVDTDSTEPTEGDTGGDEFGGGNEFNI